MSSAGSDSDDEHQALPPPPMQFDALTDAHVDTFTEVFEVFDQQGHGRLHCSDLRVALRMVGLETTREESRGYAQVFCGDRDAGFTLPEFLSVCDDVMSQRPADARASHLEDAFAMLDTEKTGHLAAAQIGAWSSSADAAGFSAEDGAGAPSVGFAADDDLDMVKLLEDLGMAGQGMGREDFIKLLSQSESVI
jgi:Ca2+-binding EF-hand superfamily protein